MKNLKQILYSLYRVICIALTTALFTWFIGMNGQHGRKHLAKLMFCILEKKKKKVLFYPLQYQTEPTKVLVWKVTSCNAIVPEKTLLYYLTLV